MQYPELHQQGFRTSTGVVEAGCKVVIGSRLKRAGMPLRPGRRVIQPLKSEVHPFVVQPRS